jgi:citrate-Mg2+:H+ or citrate-Ca2+:H+ symporter, CitMHS family
MMLAGVGLITILCVLAAILSKRASPLVALIAVPVIASLASGFGLRTGAFILKGIAAVAPVASMFIFAILYFGIVTDAGMLDPLVDLVLKAVGNRPSRIVAGTAVLALLIHLDGSGAVTFLVTVPLMLPLYERLGIDKRILACAASMAAGVNFLPWTGPMIRESAALHIPVSNIFRPLIPIQAIGLIFTFTASFWLGKREERRLKDAAQTELSTSPRRVLSGPETLLRRPRLFWPNLVLTAVSMGIMISGRVEPVVVFMIALVIALTRNYPAVNEQRKRMEAHARPALLMASILFAAGAFTGIMRESGMLDAMAHVAVQHLPSAAARHLPIAIGVLGMPLSLLFDPDSFYFGVLPVLAEVGKQLGIPPLQIGQSALLGMHTTGFPVSPLTPATYLLVGLCEIELGEHQRFATPYLFLASVVMTAACVAFGVFSL